MKKTICITPHDKTIRGWAEALWILNEFKILGYTKREVFVKIVFTHLPAYATDFKRAQQLQHFWAVRERSPVLLRDLNQVIEILKYNDKTNNHE